MKGPRYLTDCGLEGVRWIPYGLHACHPYQGPEDLAEAAVAFLLAGLYLGERCLWITAPPLPADVAREALQAAWPGCDAALARGALSIVPCETWYGDEPDRILEALVGEEERARREGYRGLRVSCNAMPLLTLQNGGFAQHQRLVTERLRDRRVIMLCSYEGHALRHRKAVEASHDCCLERLGASWQIRDPDALPGPGREAAGEVSRPAARDRGGR